MCDELAVRRDAELCELGDNVADRGGHGDVPCRVDYESAGWWTPERRISMCSNES